MDDQLALTPAPHDGLTVRSADLFPLLCTRCQRRFTQLQDFIVRTTPIFQSSGLMQREEPDTGGTYVLLLRNCLCGASLALRCQDRRNQTDQGRLRRNRFGTLVNLLVEVGVEPAKAEQEVRRLLHEASA